MSSDVQFVTSPLLLKSGVRHGWFTRYGGVSKGLFESLNGKKGIGDPDKNVDENRRRAAAIVCHPELGFQSGCSKDSCPCRSSTLAHILHEFKTNVLEATEAGEYSGFDASYSVSSDIVLSQTTADCGTVVLTDTEGSLVSLVHGSWHTLKDEIICDVITKLKQHTSNELIAGIGPMICKNCYEFGPEAKELFDKKYRTEKNGKYFIDLKQMIIDQLHESGITRVDDLNICTLEDDRFFSHRRSGSNSGRFLTIATL